MVTYPTSRNRTRIPKGKTIILTPTNDWIDIDDGRHIQRIPTQSGRGDLVVKELDNRLRKHLDLRPSNFDTPFQSKIKKTIDIQHLEFHSHLPTHPIPSLSATIPSSSSPSSLKPKNVPKRDQNPNLELQTQASPITNRFHSADN